MAVRRRFPALQCARLIFARDATNARTSFAVKATLVERLEIRGRLLHLLEEEGFAQPQLWNGAHAFALDPDELSQILAQEFGVILPPADVPELLTVTWLVDLVERQYDGDSIVM
jgi:hypothetical protein